MKTQDYSGAVYIYVEMTYIYCIPHFIGFRPSVSSLTLNVRLSKILALIVFVWLEVSIAYICLDCIPL